MKLIDILVQELPKRGGWPEKASQCAQDSGAFDFRVCFYTSGRIRNNGSQFMIPERSEVKWVHRDLKITGHEASDQATAIITREQYEAALAAKNDGWIKWAGGECPVDTTKTLVDIKFKNDCTFKSCHPGDYSWRHAGLGGDIIAYRLHNPQEVTESDEEADLNDCIGQDVAPVWSGEGLPPVGCECERSWCGDNWLACTVLFVSAETVVVKLATREAAYGVSEVKFRPIRSEEDKKREGVVQEILKILEGPGSPYSDAKARKIYDAIVDGKVRGVKLED